MELRRELSVSAALLQAGPFASPLSPPTAVWLNRDDSFATHWPLSALPPLDSQLARDYTSSSPVASSPAAAVAADSSSSHGLQLTAAGSPMPFDCQYAVMPSPPSLTATPSFCAAAVPLTPTEEQQQQLRASLDPGPIIVKHRSADAQRRRRERLAVRRLEELVGAAGGAESEQRPSTASAARQKRKQHKLSVLQACAARIERLEQQLSLSELSNRLSESRLQRMSDEINDVLQRERLGLQWLDANRSLRGAALLDDRIAVTLLECRTGRLLNANSAFFSLTGFTPGGVLQRILDPVMGSFDDQQTQQSSSSSSSTATAELPLVKARRRSMDGPIRWVPLQPCRQYPRTMAMLQALLTAQRDSCRAPFRCRWLDGHAYEIKAHFWPSDTEWVEEADGSSWQRPLSIMVAASVDECCRVDEE